MPRPLILVTVIALAMLMMLGAAAGSQAAPGNLRILVDGNNLDPNLPTELTGKPGVATVDTFDSSGATPTAAQFASYDLVVDTGDGSYFDKALYGDRLADFIDAGGAVIQFAYDNWESANAHPTGRFESDGYPPFIPGPNDNSNTSLGTLLVPDSPLLAGVPSFTTGDNVTDDLAPGATLLAKWADDRNAIATKGRVVSVTASPESGGNFVPLSAAAQLVINAGNVLGPHTLTVTKSGAGAGTVTSSPAGINCGQICATTFLGATTVTLTAVTTKGSFTGWSGVGCGKSASCTFTPSATTTVTAKFDACVVPKVKGKRLKQAKKRLKKGDCRLGKVKNKGPGKVKKQKPKPGTALPVNSKVNVTLG